MARLESRLEAFIGPVRSHDTTGINPQPRQRTAQQPTHGDPTHQPLPTAVSYHGQGRFEEAGPGAYVGKGNDAGRLLLGRPRFATTMLVGTL